MSQPTGARLLSRMSLLAATVLVLGGLATTAPAHAGTDNFGQSVYSCAGMMLPYSIDSQGSITTLMPDGTTMHWRSFGAMVTYMRTQQMCQ